MDSTSIAMSNVYSSVGKPAALTGFGLVTQSNAPAFVPFNSTTAPFASDNRENLIEDNIQFEV